MSSSKPSTPSPNQLPSLDSEEITLPLTIRFSASIPDLPLDISTPESTTAAGLKQLIRSRLPSDLSAHRLRLIYAGRALDDATPLTVSLKLPPPSRARTPVLGDDGEDLEEGTGNGSGKGKGKEPLRERPRLYIHCSIGDIVLSEGDLAAEAAASSTTRDQTEPPASQQQPAAQQTTTPAPRGFDRLLSAGFTAAEVTALRSQFLAAQSVSRTPDTMPSGSELRDLEDRWMDEGSTGMGGGGGGVSVGDDDDGGFGAGSRGAVDDMLWGAVMGFFWPVG
ncbi:conserved membrane protein, partial [Aspergillus sclerotialis]